jgi:hypothetical protein
MAKSKYVLTEKQIIKRINEDRGVGRLSDYKPWLYVNEIPSEGRSQRVYSHLTGPIHHVLSDLEWLYGVKGYFDEVITDELSLTFEHISAYFVQHPERKVVDLCKMYDMTYQQDLGQDFMIFVYHSIV